MWDYTMILMAIMIACGTIEGEDVGIAAKRKRIRNYALDAAWPCVRID